MTPEEFLELILRKMVEIGRSNRLPENRMMCSWCHELNEVGPMLSAYCWNCGHRSDSPRSLCDCQMCQQPFGERQKGGKGSGQTT